MSDRPRVFQEGTVTVVLGPDGVRVYAGSAEVRTASEVRMNTAFHGAPNCLITVDESSEEDVRLVRSTRLAQAVLRPGPSSS